MSVPHPITELLLDAIDNLVQEVGSFKTEDALWQLPDGVSNSAGTLCLHLIGNLHHFIGATLGNSGYVRNRAAEFAERDVPQAVLLDNLAEVRDLVKATLAACSDAMLNAPFPLSTFGEGRTTLYVLLVLLAHAKYHIGQINYLRRIVERGAHA